MSNLSDGVMLARVASRMLRPRSRFPQVQHIAIRIFEIYDLAGVVLHDRPVKLHTLLLERVHRFFDRRGEHESDRDRSIAARWILFGCRVQPNHDLFGVHLRPVISESLRQPEAEYFGVESDRTIHVGYENRRDPFCKISCRHGSSLRSPLRLVKSHFEKTRESTAARYSTGPASSLAPTTSALPATSRDHRSRPPAARF